VLLTTNKLVIMKKNMGIIDRVVRILAAITFIVLYATGVVAGALGIVLLVFAGIFILTSIVGSCPLYLPFGLSTCCKSCKSCETIEAEK
jgi:hypothetical protein